MCQFKGIVYLSCFFMALTGCIKDDIIQDEIEPTLRIISKPDTIAVGGSFQFTAMYLNSVGEKESVTSKWSSSDPSIIQINEDGLATGIDFGIAGIYVEYNNGENTLIDSLWVSTGVNTVEKVEERTGTVNTTSSYELFGDFILTEEGSDLRLTFSSNYVCTTALPGAYVYLTNNPATISGALELGPVEIFSGSHDYLIPGTGINDFSHVLYFCKPFNVKVGDGQINE